VDLKKGVLSPMNTKVKRFLKILDLKRKALNAALRAFLLRGSGKNLNPSLSQLYKTN